MPEGTGDRAGSDVRSIDRAVAILRCFDARRPELGLSEIARAVGLSTSTTHRLLGAMQVNHLVRQTRDRRYGLGPLLLQIARSGAMQSTLRDVALPMMIELRNAVDETIGLHELLPTGERMVVEQVESRQELRRTYTDIGVPLRLPHAAPGRVILALLPARQQADELATPVSPVTERTVTDPDTIRADLELIRDRGWASSRSERAVGICAVAAPVFDATGAVIGSLSLSAPEVRMSEERIAELGPRVQAVAWQVSQGMGATTSVVSVTYEAARVPRRG